ncbi:hypothetical protein J7K50_07025 [bacterium]|nr:hypothetical protein [bacterium]
MIIVDNIWTYENGHHGILDFTVVGVCNVTNLESRLPVRAVEKLDRDLRFVNEDSLEEFVSKFSDEPDATLEWLRRVLIWQLNFHRSPSPNMGFA